MSTVLSNQIYEIGQNDKIRNNKNVSLGFISKLFMYLIYYVQAIYINMVI